VRNAEKFLLNLRTNKNWKVKVVTDEEDEVEEAEEYEPEKDAQRRIIEKREKPKEETD